MAVNSKYIFKRPCRRCGKLYKPTGKYQDYCEPCKKKARASRKGVKLKRIINRI